MANDVFPFVFAAAHHNNLKVVNCSTDLQSLRNDQNSGDFFSCCDSVGDVIGHGLAVVRHDDSAIVRSPRQQFRVGSSAETHVVGGDRIQIWDTVSKASQDVLIEVLIYEQPEHSCLVRN